MHAAIEMEVQAPGVRPPGSGPIIPVEGNYYWFDPGTMDDPSVPRMLKTKPQWRSAHTPPMSEEEKSKLQASIAHMKKIKNGKA